MGSLRARATIGLLVAGLSTLAHAAKLEDVAPYPKDRKSTRLNSSHS